PCDAGPDESGADPGHRRPGGGWTGAHRAPASLSQLRRPWPAELDGTGWTPSGPASSTVKAAAGVSALAGAARRRQQTAPSPARSASSARTLQIGSRLPAVGLVSRCQVWHQQPHPGAADPPGLGRATLGPGNGEVTVLHHVGEPFRVSAVDQALQV